MIFKLSFISYTFILIHFSPYPLPVTMEIELVVDRLAVRVLNHEPHVLVHVWSEAHLEVLTF